MSDIVQIISKLGMDASEVYAELDKVNSKYQENTAHLRKQKDELASLVKFEQGLQAERAKSNNPSIVAQFNQKIDENKAKIAALTKTIQAQTAELGKAKTEGDKFKKGLGEAMDGTAKKATSLKSQLKTLKEQIALTDDDDEFLRLSIEAGKLEDKIGDAGNAARIFASDSKFEILGNAFGNIGQKLLAMDFDGAVEGSKLLLKASKDITFKETFAGIKQVGQVLGNIGKALLTNPLFLIGATIGLLVSVWSDLTDSIKTTNEALKANAEASKKSREEIDELIRANRDLALENQITAGKINKENGEKLKNQNKFKDEYLKILKEQREAETLANEDMKKQKEEDGFKATKRLFEFLGGETDLTKLHKQRLLDIEQASAEKIAQLKLKFGLENDKILIEQANEEAKKRKETAEKIAKETEENNKKYRDLRIANIRDEQERERLILLAKFQDDLKEAKNDQLIQKELQIKYNRDLLALEEKFQKERQAVINKANADAEQANAEVLAEMLDAEDKRKARLEDQLNEEQRHQQALLAIKLDGHEDAAQLLLAQEIAFETARLQQIAEFYGVESDEFKKQTNKLEELRARFEKNLEGMDKKRIARIIEDTKKIVDAAIDAAEKIIAAEINKVDKLISLQQKRVDEVAKIAEKGNAELLELEKERLEKLNKEKEKFVRQQQALAVIELIANTAVTVSKAAAEGGAGAAVTIAAALIALIGGLAAARSIAGQAAFYDGGEYDGQGYTGNGNPREESTAVGRKPYKYHKKEYIFNHETTGKYLDIFRQVHAGKLDLNKMKFESDMYKMLSAAGIDTSKDIHYRNSPKNNEDLSSLRGDLREVKEAIKGQSRLKVNIDRDGIAVIATEYIKDRKRINAIAR